MYQWQQGRWLQLGSSLKLCFVYIKHWHLVKMNGNNPQFPRLPPPMHVRMKRECFAAFGEGFYLTVMHSEITWLFLEICCF